MFTEIMCHVYHKRLKQGYVKSTQMLRTQHEVCVKHVHGFVFPWIFTLQIDCVEKILHQNGHYHCQQNCVLKAKKKVDNASLKLSR